MALEVVALARSPFEGAKYPFSMATLMSNTEPVAVSNLSGTPVARTEPLSLFKSQKPDSLSSIASASLHVSRSRDQLPPMTSPSAVPADRPDHDKEAERNSSQVAREALGASEKSPGAPIHEPVVHASPEQMQVDSHATESPSDPYGSNDHHHNSLMHSSTVASPGPIEESTSQDGDRRPRDDSELDHDGKSFSYPMPTGNINDPRRGLSLPNAGYNRGSPRSPSAKKHRCPYCSTEFTRQHNLKSHLLTHSQEKPFVCQTCQSRFRRLHDLKRHTKLHTGERPHICPKCGRRFARGDALARHNKGQGGCAGRRASMGSFADDEYGDGGAGPDDMDGLMYTAEPERMDEEDERRLMPSIRKHEAETVARSDSLQSRQSNTYPPIAANRPSHLFPPPPNHGGSSASGSTSQAGNLTFPPAGHASGSTIFPTNNISDSPKPLSPGALSSQHDSAPPHRAHSPGMGQSLPHPQSSFGRGSQSSNHAPTLGLPLPQPGVPQLPPPPGMTSPDARFGLQAAAKHTPSHSHSSTHSITALKGPEGLEVNSGDATQVDKLWSYVRGMHEELNALRTEVSTLRAHIASSNLSAPPAPVEVNMNNAGPR
jgi:hypothetical protein